MNKELLKGLTEEQLEKASKCKTNKELLELAKQEGVELSEEQLASVSGGACEYGVPPKESVCPQCHASVNGQYVETTPGDGKYHFICINCGYEWTEK